MFSIFYKIVTFSIKRLQKGGFFNKMDEKVRCEKAYQLILEFSQKIKKKGKKSLDMF